MWRVAEFYCGIGGLHFALQNAIPAAVIVAAFDIDCDSNLVYEHNTQLTPTKVDIGTLSATFLESLDVNVWLLSPPCQPYTRQGLRRDAEDPRAKSFLQLLEKLKQMKTGPEYFLLENVVGFDHSSTRRLMLQSLEVCQLASIQEAIISPEQFGVPYSRPRYFCLARKRPFPLPLDIPTCPQVSLKSIVEEVDEDYEVPVKFLEQCSDVMNVISVDSDKPVNCFTKSYGGRYFKGTGSFLASSRQEWIPLLQRIQELCGSQSESASARNLDLEVQEWIGEINQMDHDALRQSCRRRLVEMLKEMHIRYFTPSEVAALHGFPSEFRFPEGMTRRRQYALLGNSLSVIVVSWLIQYLMA